MSFSVPIRIRDSEAPSSSNEPHLFLVSSDGAEVSEVQYRHDREPNKVDTWNPWFLKNSHPVSHDFSQAWFKKLSEFSLFDPEPFALPSIFTRPVHPPIDQDSSATLRDTFAQLDHIADMVAELDLDEPPDQSTIEDARELITKIHDVHPVEYHVYPTERKGVEISAPMRKGGSVSIECMPNDIVHCFVAIDGNLRRAKYYQTDGLPDAFMKSALQDLAKG